MRNAFAVVLLFMGCHSSEHRDIPDKAESVRGVNIIVEKSACELMVDTLKLEIDLLKRESELYREQRDDYQKGCDPQQEHDYQEPFYEEEAV